MEFRKASKFSVSQGFDIMFLFRQSLRRCFPLLPALPVVTMDSDTAVTFGTMDSDTAVTFVRPP